jgi:capsular polysaccharide biosynthesis protein
MKFVFAAPSPDDLIRLLKAWRFWLLGAVVGVLIGAAVFFVAPPSYRARATVNVDFHLEQAWPQNTDREQFYYLERETRKLELIAESDPVLDAVVSQVSGVTLQQLRAGKLQLSQPGNGGWHFYADDRDPKKAAALASAWAQAFAATVQEDVIAAAASGLEPYITVSADQAENLPAQRRTSLSTYLFAGALVFLALGAFGILFLDRKS